MTDIKAQNILERLTTICVEHLGVEAEKVTPESHIEDDLKADSLDAVELIMAVEEEFEIEIQDEEAEKLKTVQQIADFVGTKI